MIISNHFPSPLTPPHRAVRQWAVWNLHILSLLLTKYPWIHITLYCLFISYTFLLLGLIIHIKEICLLLYMQFHSVLRHFYLLWPLLTPCDKLFNQVFYSCFKTSRLHLFTRPHGISHKSFLVYPLDLPIRVTIAFWTLLCLANLSA